MANMTLPRFGASSKPQATAQPANRQMGLYGGFGGTPQGRPQNVNRPDTLRSMEESLRQQQYARMNPYPKYVPDNTPYVPYKTAPGMGAPPAMSNAGAAYPAGFVPRQQPIIGK